MKNRQVAHVWAQQSSPHATGSSFYFNGPTIYSYGPHFPIARFIEHKGKRAVLFTTRGYSVSTSKHIGYTRNALYGLSVPVFHVENPGDTPRHADMRKAYLVRVASLLEQAARARTSTAALDAVETVAREGNTYAEFFGLRWRVKVPAWSDQYRDELRAKGKAKSAKQAAETKKRNAAKLAEWEKRVRDWRAGADVSTHGAGLSFEVPTLLRVQGNRIQTSRGAEVPVRVAPVVWALVQKARAEQAEVRSGVELGAFHLDAVQADGAIRAGCHVIAYPEIEGIARQLGLIALTETTV